MDGQAPIHTHTHIYSFKHSQEPSRAGTHAVAVWWSVVVPQTNEELCCGLIVETLSLLGVSSSQHVAQEARIRLPLARVSCRCAPFRRCCCWLCRSTVEAAESHLEEERKKIKNHTQRESATQNERDSDVERHHWVVNDSLETHALWCGVCVCVWECVVHTCVLECVCVCVCMCACTNVDVLWHVCVSAHDDAPHTHVRVCGPCRVQCRDTRMGGRFSQLPHTPHNGAPSSSGVHNAPFFGGARSSQDTAAAATVRQRQGELLTLEAGVLRRDCFVQERVEDLVALVGGPAATVPSVGGCSRGTHTPTHTDTHRHVHTHPPTQTHRHVCTHPPTQTHRHAYVQAQAHPAVGC